MFYFSEEKIDAVNKAFRIVKLENIAKKCGKHVAGTHCENNGFGNKFPRCFRAFECRSKAGKKKVTGP